MTAALEAGEGGAMTWTFELPIDLPSANRHGGAATNARHAANAAIYRRQRVQYATVLIAMARLHQIPRYQHVVYPAPAPDMPDHLERPPFRAVELVRLWGKGCRAWDDDNMVAAVKGLRDSFQASRFKRASRGGGRVVAGAGLVWDDSARWSSWSYGQERSADGRPGVRVTITDGAP